MTALAALNRARAAWERTQPQMVISGWADWLDSLDAGGGVQRVEPVELDETEGTTRPGGSGVVVGHESTLRLVEPARLTGGAEPRHAPLAVHSRRRVSPSAISPADGSAPFSCDGPDALSVEGQRRGQEGA